MSVGGSYHIFGKCQSGFFAYIFTKKEHMIIVCYCVLSYRNSMKTQNSKSGDDMLLYWDIGPVELTKELDLRWAGDVSISLRIMSHVNIQMFAEQTWYNKPGNDSSHHSIYLFQRQSVFRRKVSLLCTVTINFVLYCPEKRKCWKWNYEAKDCKYYIFK